MRNGLRALLVLLLILPLLVQPLPVAAQSAGEALVIIGELQESEYSEDILIPANVSVTPRAGLDEQTPVQLVIDVTVNGQPMADTALSVSAVGVIGLFTDTHGRMQVATRDLGSWADLTSPQGIDLLLMFEPPAGTIAVTLHLVVDGDPPTPLSPLTTRTFDLNSPGQSLAARIQQDYRDGVISADDAARYSLLSAIDPDYRAEPYAALYDDDIPEDPQDLGMFAVTLFPVISDATREELQAYFTADSPPGATVEGTAGAAAAGPPASVAASAAGPADFPDCRFVRVVWQCVTRIGGGDPETGGDPINLDVAYALGDGPGEVPAVDDDGNQRPDQVDDVVATFIEAWRFFRNDLDMRVPEDTVTVRLGNTPGGLSLPGVVGGGTIWLQAEATSYLVRHELFHQVQYRYLSPADVAAHYHPMLWLLESSAEWAAYEAEQRLGSGMGAPAGAYADGLPEALGAPHRTLDDTDQWAGGPEYGSFAFIEYLDQAFGGPGVVEDVLLGSGDGIAGRRPTDVIADVIAAQGSTWADAIVEYRQWSYLLTRDPAHGVGFTAPDSDGDGVNDIDQHWRAALQTDPRTRGATGRQAARPARTFSADFSSWTEFTSTGTTSVFPGGAAYIELDLPAGLRVADITITTSSNTIHATSMLTSTYPELCQQPFTVHVRPPRGEADAVVSSQCNHLVMALVNTAHPAAGAQRVHWSISGTAEPGHTSFLDPYADLVEYTPYVTTPDNPDRRNVRHDSLDILRGSMTYDTDLEVRVTLAEAQRQGYFQITFFKLDDMNTNWGFGIYTDMYPYSYTSEDCTASYDRSGPTYTFRYTPGCFGDEARIGIQVSIWGGANDELPNQNPVHMDHVGGWGELIILERLP